MKTKYTAYTPLITDDHLYEYTLLVIQNVLEKHQYLIHNKEDFRNCLPKAKFLRHLKIKMSIELFLSYQSYCEKVRLSADLALWNQNPTT